MSSTTTVRVVGNEGLHAREIALTNHLRAFGFRTAAVILFPAAPYFLRKASALSADTGMASVGAESEQIVVAALRAHESVTAVHSGRHLSRTSKEDIDQIAFIASGAVAVIEVKTRFGFVTVKDGVLVSGKDERPFHGDPFAQVTRGAGHVVNALDGLLVGPVHRVICVAKAPNKAPFTHDGITVCTAATLPAVLDSLSRSVEDTDRAEAAVRKAHKRGRR